MSLSVLAIIPAYNEEKSIAQVIRKIKSCRPETDIVVVNDGSTDGTSRAARSTGLARVVDLPVNVGIGGAMQTGYLYADRLGYDIAVQIDGDGQHDPEELDNVISAVASGETDCCVGSRFLHGASYRSTAFRRVGIAFFAWMIHWMVGKKVTDPTSGFRAVNRDVIALFARYYPYDYPEVEAIAMLVRRGYRVTETPVRMHSRQAGKSSITPAKSMYYMMKVSLAVLMTRIRDVR